MTTRAPLTDEFELEAPPAPRPRKPGRWVTESNVQPSEVTADLFVRGIAKPKAKKPSQNKAGENNFAFQCRAYQLPPVDQQFKLLKTVQTPRKDGKNIPNVWKFDFVWPAFKLIVEVDGGIWMAGGGAHSHPLDIERNMDKQNDATLAGFHILRFSPKQVKAGHAIAFTQCVLHARGWRR